MGFHETNLSKEFIEIAELRHLDGVGLNMRDDEESIENFSNIFSCKALAKYRTQLEPETSCGSSNLLPPLKVW